MTTTDTDARNASLVAIIKELVALHDIANDRANITKLDTVLPIERVQAAWSRAKQAIG